MGCLAVETRPTFFFAKVVVVDVVVDAVVDALSKSEDGGKRKEEKVRTRAKAA